MGYRRIEKSIYSGPQLLDLSISMDDVRPIIERFAATEKQVHRAAIRALKKIVGNIGTAVKKEVASEANIPLKSLKNRVKGGNQALTEPVVRLWFGANPVPLSAIGKPRESKAGVKWGRFPRLYKGAFIATMPAARGREYGHEGGFIRYYSKHYNPNLYPRTGGGPHVHPSPRLPIYEPSPIDISGEMEDAIENHGEEALELFQKRFAEELNYEVNVRVR